mgnify:CR=1 FL=1
MKAELKKLIDTAAGRIPADLVIKNCKVVNVFSGKIQEGDIAFSGDQIAGIGEYEGKEVIDAEGRYAAPGFIDSHIHIESSYVCPEEIGRLLVPHGGTTIMADPHEIVNVCGIAGLDYMMKAAENTVLDVKYELPSCVPATPWEHSGAVIDAEAMKEPITREGIAGLGEFMNFPGVINAADSDLDKIIVAKREGKFVDGHGPGIAGKDLNAYAAARIAADHECSTVEEMNDRLDRGMYILLRQGAKVYYSNAGEVADSTFKYLFYDMNWLFFCGWMFLFCIIVVIVVSLATEAPTAEKIQGLVFGTATKEQKAATRASWDHWDIIHTVIILAITGAFYWYFW